MAREMYQIEVRHEGLNKYRQIRGSDPYVVEQKARAQSAVWDEMWEKREEKRETAEHKQAQKQYAESQTTDVAETISGFRCTLRHTLAVNDAIVWDSLKDHKHFSEQEPREPEYLAVPVEPTRADAKYQPKLGFWDKIFLWWGERKIADAGKLFERDHAAWARQGEEIPQTNAKKKERYSQELREWEARRKVFVGRQAEKNAQIDKRQQEYMVCVPAAIVDYCDMVLANSSYPDDFPQEYELDYIAETRILLVDYSFPPMECLPRTKEFRYVASRDEIDEIPLKDAERNAVYDDLLYQITLRTIHELFEADVAKAIDAVVFNGYVRSIDAATGKEVNPCILSVQASRDVFTQIDLAKVDPKACFKKLKGTGSAQLSGLAAVAPIMKIDREDTRFVPAYAVADRLNEGDNLATMDWEDFEHLIRELFEWEFSKNGAEVKITQASRDWGVDAVVFDPDPLRGGKIVVQAKRYNNAVGFAAVRELYGTVINEGAIKGILVTTSDYGPDAYEFAKDKPLTLLNGSNLLHLLEKHGHKARIDLREGM